MSVRKASDAELAEWRELDRLHDAAREADPEHGGYSSCHCCCDDLACAQRFQEHRARWDPALRI